MQTQLPAQIQTVWRLRALIDGLLWVILAVGFFIAHLLWSWPWWLIAVALGLGLLHVAVT
nr:hypothetical protein [Lacticaseibacillus manihotivorans]